MKIKKFFLQTLKIIAKPFIGIGFFDTYLPYLNVFFQKIYAFLQTNDTQQIELSTGQKILVYSRDVCIGINLIMSGTYEPVTTKLFLDCLKKNDAVLDIGANNGYYSLLASNKIGKKGIVYAFEPDINNLKLLEKNIDLNCIKNIKIEKLAAIDINKTVEFSSDSIHTGKSTIILDKKLKSSKVNGISLDSFFKNKSKRINVIIMDIEGSELLALKGAEKIIRNNENLILFLEFNPESIKSFRYSPEELINYILKLGFYSISIIDETRGKVILFSKKNLDQVLRHTTYCNLMCKKI